MKKQINISLPDNLIESLSQLNKTKYDSQLNFPALIRIILNDRFSSISIPKEESVVRTVVDMGEQFDLNEQQSNQAIVNRLVKKPKVKVIEPKITRSIITLDELKQIVGDDFTEEFGEKWQLKSHSKE